jgi:hypothetical protein
MESYIACTKKANLYNLFAFGHAKGGEYMPTSLNVLQCLHRKDKEIKPTSTLPL